MNKLIIIPVILLCHSAVSFAETQLTISPALLHFDYTEFSTTDQELDNESGWLPGLEAKLSHSFASDWSFAIVSAYYSGTVDYVGQTQSGTPHTTDTETDLFRIGGQINKEVYKKIRLFFGAQSHQWNRDIKDTDNVSGIDETYKWLEYSIGLNSDIIIRDNEVLNLEAAYLMIRNGTINVDLSRVNLGTADLDLGDGSGARFSLSWKKNYQENTRYGIGLFYETWDFGRSNTKQTQNSTTIVFVTEPRSETRNIGLQFNIEYMF